MKRGDAAALAAADVGLGLGARAAAASAEAADVVLLVDDLHQLLPRLEIARRRIALESSGGRVPAASFATSDLRKAGRPRSTV